MKKPKTTVGDGARDKGGRFVAGNKVARGNPLASRVAKLRTAMFKAVSDKDMIAIISRLVELAKEGDVQAAKEILTRTLGKPQEIDLLARMDALEEMLTSVQGQPRCT